MGKLKTALLGIGLLVWPVTFIAGIGRLVSVHAQPAESTLNIPVGACVSTGQCWNGKYWYKPPEPHKTRVWKVTGTDSIWVIETTGVCLYMVLRGEQQVALSAIPKTQLPVGAGCE